MLCTCLKANHGEVQHCRRHGRTTSGLLLMYSKGTAGTIWALGTRVASSPPIDACNLRKASPQNHATLLPAQGCPRGCRLSELIESLPRCEGTCIAGVCHVRHDSWRDCSLSLCKAREDARSVLHSISTISTLNPPEHKVPFCIDGCRAQDEASPGTLVPEHQMCCDKAAHALACRDAGDAGRMPFPHIPGECHAVVHLTQQVPGCHDHASKAEHCINCALQVSLLCHYMEDGNTYHIQN